MPLSVPEPPLRKELLRPGEDRGVVKNRVVAYADDRSRGNVLPRREDVAIFFRCHPWELSGDDGCEPEGLLYHAGLNISYQPAATLINRMNETYEIR